MPDDPPETETRPSPDDAFALLGNDTRVAILRILGEADEPLTFSELHDRVEMRDSGQFNYHLEKLVGHFVKKAEDGYTLRRTGRRVVEAVLSGAVTETPSLSRTPVDETCNRCGAPVEISWTSGSVRMYCTECAGTYGRARGERPAMPAERGYLGRLPLPPAGVRNRTPDEVLRAAWTWGNLEIYAMASGICPRCSATVETETYVCDDHDASDGLCPACESVYAVHVGMGCTNCIFKSGGAAAIALLTETALLTFQTEHDLNPIAPDSIRVLNDVHSGYDEEILQRDPLRVRFTFHVDDDCLSLTVDENLDVVDVAR
jgi:DNA-binding transcriptional ArsR family regulator